MLEIGGKFESAVFLAL